MSSNFKTKKFQELLDRLQQESWQLELIISGFSILGLFSALPEIKLGLAVADNDGHIFMYVILMIAFIACYILIFNLVLHLILRGLWIGALGLRYVSGDIDFETLNYHSRFNKYLKKKIISFDRYIANLENYCSVLFAISFLLIFYVISIAAISVLIAFTVKYISDYNDAINGWQILFVVFFILFILFGSFLVFIDFLTQGFLKKKRFLSKIYFPFYWVFSFITLSFLYRPLVYNFLDNKFTKRLSFLLIPIYIGIALLSSLKFKNSNYLELSKTNDAIYLDNSKYEDLLIEDNKFVDNASIQSKIITSSYINFFKVFNKKIEDKIYKYHPSLKPEEDQRGLQSALQYFYRHNSPFKGKKKDSLINKYLSVFNEVYQIHIDSIQYQSDFLIGKNKKEQTGFQTFISTKKLTEGKHILSLKRKEIKQNDTLVKTDVIIPFWYYKNN